LEALSKQEVSRMKIHSWLIGSLEYFQGEPHVSWYWMNKDELDDVEMVVGMPKLHVLNTKTYLVDPLIQIMQKPQS
jgi:hypothetical protein